MRSSAFGSRWSKLGYCAGWADVELQLCDGRAFDDVAPVRALDCIALIRRWSARDAFGQTFATFVEAYRVVDQRSSRIRLKRPFPLLPDALGKLSSNVPFRLPEWVAQTEPTRLISDPTGSSPWRFQVLQWVPGQDAFYERFAR